MSHQIKVLRVNIRSKYNKNSIQKSSLLSICSDMNTQYLGVIINNRNDRSRETEYIDLARKQFRFLSVK